MGTLTAQSILDKASIQLIDIPAVRWTRPELLEWLNDAQRTIVMLAPSSSNFTTTVSLAAGTRQSIPSDGWLFLDAYRNMSAGGAPGRAVRLVSKKLLDSFNPDWHSDTGVAVAKNYLFDPQDQTTFWVYPPNDGTGHLQINYSRLPVACATEGDAIYLNDILQTAILDYILYRACSKDAEYAPGIQLASGYWTAFTTAIGAKAAAEQANNPNINLVVPKDSSKPGAQE